ncbi:MAG: hypothetical protein GHCLOJNM_03530 [bacterium]|nr:hypothetical protein [bacterium]
MVTFTEERMAAARIIESLRAGVPTRSSTRDLPDLRSDFTRAICEDLNALTAGEVVRGRLLWGQYGQGKSHTLKRIEHLALDHGFAVSSVTLSREVSCHNLYNFYGRVANSLRTPKSNMLGLQNQLMKLSKESLDASPLRKADRYCHALPSVVVDLFLQASTEEDRYKLYTGLLGDPLRVPDVRAIAKTTDKSVLDRAIGGFRKGTHAQAYFGVLADTIRLCALKGWVILIDEVELIARLGGVSRLNAYRNLNWLLNWTRAMPYQIYTVGAAATSLQEVWYTGSGRRRDDRSLMPEMAENRIGEDGRREMADFFETGISSQCLKIVPIERSSLRGLIEKLVQIHSIAHDWTPGSDVDVFKATGSLHPDTPVRTQIRAALEALDQARLSGVAPSIQAGKLTEYGMEEDEEFFDSEGA